MKLFGILHLSSRTIHTDAKGNIYKKFTTMNNNVFNVKTKRTTLSDVFCIVCSDTKTVLEYYDRCSPDDIPVILTKLYWKNCLKNLDLDLIKNKDLNKSDRIELSNHIAYTIDPEGSIDRDDAIGIDIESKTIYIHIADPSSFIEKDSILDKELYNRVQSIYLDKTYHMMPDLLSTHIISLTEGEKCRAFTLELNFKDLDSCEIISHRFIKTFIQVKNLTYEEANYNLKTNEDLINLTKIYNKIGKIGKIGKIDKLDKIDFHKIVEFYMIKCNEYVATELKDIPSIIRYNKYNEYNQYNEFDISKYENIEPELIKMYLMSNNEAATYEINTEHTGHMLLNLEHYTHFTSPIRRYIDLVLHRQLYSKSSYSEEELKKICFYVNEINKNYKLAYNIHKFNILLKDISSIELECNIIYLEENLIKVYNKEHDMVFFINIIHSMLINNLHSNSIEDITNQKVQLKLFEKIKIKIFKLKNSVKPYKISLLEPLIELF
jgi:hypothetical protein